MSSTVLGKTKAMLSNKGINPDILVMTATPIPELLR